MTNFSSQWNEAWSHVESQPWYPDEQVVRFLARYVVRRTGISQDQTLNLIGAQPRGLDVGCGKGRHVITMAELNLDAYGVDISNVAVEFAQNWLAEKNLIGTVQQADIDKLPFSDAFFDFVVCHGVLDHMLGDTRAKGISEICRLIRPGGYFFFSVISPEDSAYGEGEFLEEQTWSVEEGYEAGIPQAFFSEDRIREEFKHFDIISIVKQVNESITGRSLIGTDKQYDKDGRYYVVCQMLNDT